jgi:hypothetical protein
MHLFSVCTLMICITVELVSSISMTVLMSVIRDWYEKCYVPILNIFIHKAVIHPSPDQAGNGEWTHTVSSQSWDYHLTVWLHSVPHVAWDETLYKYSMPTQYSSHMSLLIEIQSVEHQSQLHIDMAVCSRGHYMLLMWKLHIFNCCWYFSP